MEVHNIVEDIVIARVDEIFDALKEEGNKGGLCTCDKCRMDVICYALNRTTPHYISSNRGASRVKLDGIEYQQIFADTTALVHEGLKRVNHNLRPYFEHGSDTQGQDALLKSPAFNIPTIIGRVLNGSNFEPMSDISVGLYLDGKLVSMKDSNWQNPQHVVSLTFGKFSFWPAPVPASGAGENRIFEYALKIEAPDFEPLNHFFNVAVKSEIQAASSFTLDRTFKLPDLYMFPPGGEEEGAGLY